MRKRRALRATLLAALALVGCARCGGPPSSPPERFLAGSSAVAVIVPRLSAVQEQAAALLATAATFPAAADLAEVLPALRAQLGFDPLQPPAAAEAGLDPERGLAVAFAPGQPPLLVLPARDPDRLAATVARLAADRLGARRREVVSAGGRDVVTFRTASGPPAVSLLALGKTVLVATGADGPARLAAAAALPEDSSLLRSAPFAAARAALGPTPVALAFAPPGSPGLARLPLARDGAAIGLAGSRSRLTARAALLLPAERAAAWKAALAPGPAAAVELPALPADAFLVARLSGDPAAVLRRLLDAEPAAAAALARAGLDRERDLLAPLAPGAAAALVLAPTFEVAAVSRGAAELRAQDPFRSAQLALALFVKDEAQAKAALERLARAAPVLGMKSEPLARAGGRPAFRFSRGAAALEVALDGHRLLLGGGPGRLEALLAGAGPAYAPPTEAARAALGPDTTGAVLDFGQLVKSFRALPAEAYGSGPDAFVMRSLAERVVDPAARLAAAALRLELSESAAVLELVVDARPVPEAGP